MTLPEIATQLYKLSVGGHFNHQKWTLKSLKEYLTTMFHGDTQEAVVMEIALPDGWW
jgi:hypothetical protein